MVHHRQRLLRPSQLLRSTQWFHPSQSQSPLHSLRYQLIVYQQFPWDRASCRSRTQPHPQWSLLKLSSRDDPWTVLLRVARRQSRAHPQASPMCPRDYLAPRLMLSLFRYTCAQFDHSVPSALQIAPQHQKYVGGAHQLAFVSCYAAFQEILNIQVGTLPLHMYTQKPQRSELRLARLAERLVTRQLLL